jgi:phage-related protein
MFQVVFYSTKAGNKVVRDFLRQLPIEDKKKVGEDLMTVQIGYPMGLPLCRPLGDGLMEVRTSVPSKREIRIIFAFDGDAQCLVALHAFIKKTQRTPKSDLDLAKSRKAEFIMKGG